MQQFSVQPKTFEYLATVADNIDVRRRESVDADDEEDSETETKVNNASNPCFQLFLF